MLVWLATGVVVAGVGHAAAAEPPDGEDGVVSGVGRLDGFGTPRPPGLFAFEAVHRDGQATGFVSRAFVSTGATPPVFERIGSVTCVRIEGNIATIKYVVDQTNQSVPVGEVLTVYARDGGAAAPDGVLLSAFAPGKDDGSRCPSAPKSWGGLTPQAGDVTVLSAG